jgi:methionine-rich copper-binding protein CopC
MKRWHFDRRFVGALLGALGVVALVGAGGGEAPPSEVIPHITLDRSAPADTSVVSEVKEVRLFFSDAPLMRGASVRIVNSARKLQRSGPPSADPEDPKQVTVQVEPPLPPGKYVTQWRAIADDGHVMRGDFKFEVRAG